MAASPVLAWVLRAALGPVELVGPAPEGVLALARRLDLAARIASRWGRQRLTAAVSAPEEVAGFLTDRSAALAAELGWRAAAARLAEVAARLEIPWAPLKFLALALAGVLPPGGRWAADLDVLVAPEDALRLSRGLVEAGFVAGRAPGYEHHLPPLGVPGLGAVELHVKVPGVRRAGRRRSVALGDLADAGWLAPLTELPGRVSLPVRPVLAAHALAHGLAQHGFTPHAYRSLRLLADLVDLGVEAQSWPAALEVALPPPELVAARGLVARLAAGDLTPLTEPQNALPEAVLLHHLLAGELDPDYGPSLKLRMLWYPLSDRPRVLAIAAEVARALLPAGSPGGRLWRRPIDLALRTGRAWLSRRRLSRRP